MTPSLSDIGIQATTTPESRSIINKSADSAPSILDAATKVENVEERMESPSISSPQLYSSPSLQSDSGIDSFSQETNVNRNESQTPPLPNGQVRRHPLLDEYNSTRESVEDPSRIGSLEHQSAVLNTANQDVVDNLFPSPSSGFVPPVTQEDFTLGRIPDRKDRHVMVQESKTEDVGADVSTKSAVMHNSDGESQASTPTAQTVKEQDPIEKIQMLDTTVSSKESSNTSTDSPTTPQENKHLSALSIPHRLSTSSSSSSIGDNHSQAISACSSPSTVAPQRRRSSASPVYGSGAVSQSDSLQQYMIPLKIRDFAFSEVDPRHVGARDVSAPNPRVDVDDYDAGYKSGRIESEEEEEEEEEEETFPGQGLPIGLYHAAYEFVAESEHELSVQVGQKLRLIGHVEGGWAIVIRVKEGQEDVEIPENEDTLDVDKGLVPEAYLEWLG